MNIRAITLSVVLAFLSATCSPQIPAQTESGASAIGAIEMQVSDDNLEQFGLAVSVSELASHLRENLAEWNYPLPVRGPYSHRLLAKVGKIEHGDTPVGFSFSSGNSDPRALDFQKADVLPVACELRKIDDDALIAEAKSTFSARPLSREYGQTRVTEKLIDQIGTACLNLLEELPQPASTRSQRATSSSFKPKWMPDVRVEVKEVPAVTPRSEPASAGEPEPKETGSNVEVKKEIIIHNQGNPVIFTFGHERR